MDKLQIENLCVAYGENTVLSDFNLSINEGELAVVLGPSGCGKSTLLSAISGLVRPEDGRIAFGDVCFYSRKDHINILPENRNIGFVFQSYALWPHMSVFENIAFSLKARKYPADQIEKDVSEILEIVHMQGYQTRYPGELSGGEKQRIALARSLVYNPSILLLDEPMASLDANLKASLIGEIKDIQLRLGITMLYVTHDQSEAFEIADRIIVMENGRIMQQGTPREIYHQSENLFVAGFVGRNNIFNVCGHECPKFIKKRHGKKAVAIRPEDIQIKVNGAYQGVIKKVKYKGDHTEYVIEAGESSLLICESGGKRYKNGDKVSFDIKRYQLI
jgi:ABC-type Fe3+/spermidine/putrescine transport system ATPase subunit